MTTPIPDDIRKRVMGLHRRGLNGREIGQQLGFDRSKVNYIIRGFIGARPRPTKAYRERTCPRCGRVDIILNWWTAVHCRKCARFVAAESNRKNHFETGWTTSNCRQCGTIFAIRTSELMSRRIGLRGTKPRPGFVPFCCRDCYTEYQRLTPKHLRWSGT